MRRRGRRRDGGGGGGDDGGDGDGGDGGGSGGGSGGGGPSELFGSWADRSDAAAERLRSRLSARRLRRDDGGAAGVARREHQLPASPERPSERRSVGATSTSPVSADADAPPSPTAGGAAAVLRRVVRRRVRRRPRAGTPASPRRRAAVGGRSGRRRGDFFARDRRPGCDQNRHGLALI